MLSDSRRSFRLRPRSFLIGIAVIALVCPASVRADDLTPPGGFEPAIRAEDTFARLSGDVRQEGSAKKIRSFWDRVASWFRREPGETRSADTEEAKTPAKAAAEQ